MDRIPVAGPSITQLEIDAVADVVTNGWYQNAGAPVTLFEEAFAEHTRRKFAASLPSCTSGLHLVLAALGIGPGDEVVVPDLTWIATAAPISYVGATPVFADVDPATLCLCPETLRECVTDRTKAVIVVDLYGAMPDMDALQAMCDELHIHLIEDAAEAIGSTAAGHPAGHFGIASVFSFHGSKTMTTGEGGMLVCDDTGLHDRIEVLRDHGRQPGDRAFSNTEVAFKYKMSGLQAALGRAQLQRLPELCDLKRQIHEWYVDRISDVASINLMTSPHDGVVWWMNTVFVDPATGWDKDRLQTRLADVGVDSRPVFRPLSSLPAYRAQKQAITARARNRVAYDKAPWGLNLPSALSLTADDVTRVCDELRAAIIHSPALS